MKKTVISIIGIAIMLLAVTACRPSYIFVPFHPDNTPSVDESIWDGTTKDTSWYDSNKETFSISTAEEFAGLADLVNNDDVTFKDKTIVLMENINLNNNLWTPIGPEGDDISKNFQGTFDGNGKVIRNLKIVQEPGAQAAGLFGALNGGTVKNLTIDGAEITSTSTPNSGGSTINGTAVLAGSLYLSGTVENVKISNFSVSGNRYVGGIAGYSTAGVGTEIRNCVVEDGSLIATPDNLTGTYDNGDKVGGIIGYCVTGDIVEGCSISNVSLKGYRDVSGVIGYRDTSKDGDNPVIKNNKVSNINITIDGEHDYKGDEYTEKDDYSVGPIIGDTYGGEVDGSNTDSGYNVQYINFGGKF